MNEHSSNKDSEPIEGKALNILLDTIRISGFRGIDNLEISFDQISVLFGPNNSGKTTVIKALGLALGDYGRYVTEEDFHITINEDGTEKRKEEIIVDIRIVPQDDNSQRRVSFDDDWLAEFGDNIRAEGNGQQFVAIRTKISPDEVKGGYQTERQAMQNWPDYFNWVNDPGRLTKIPLSTIENLPFFSIEAQRDIHSELKDKFSLIGKMLSGIEFDEDVNANLENAIEKINSEAVDKSAELQRLKYHLTQLNHTFQGNGSADITPFPKKIRDLSKNFSVHFGDTEQNTFAMEYHGMGTRSWASMLIVRAFVETLRMKHEKEVKPFFPILSAEEPEAHLHPNAQKTLYQQLVDTNAQVIVSTHSPYIVSMSDISHLRSLVRNPKGVKTYKLKYQISDDEKKKLAREIFAHRGEILFSRALILVEGITEEQVIPAMFETLNNRSMFDLGVSCINVGSYSNYSAFIKLANSFGIPTFIISDNDGDTRSKIKNQISRLHSEGVLLNEQNFGDAYLENPNDFEAELVHNLQIQDEIKKALCRYEIDKFTLNDQAKAAKESQINQLEDKQLLQRMSNLKSRYSVHLAEVIKENPNNKKPNELIIEAAKSAFEAIESWIPT